MKLGHPLLHQRSSKAGQYHRADHRRASRLIVILLPDVAFHLIALPLFDCVDVKAPIASDTSHAKPRQFSFPERPVNRALMDVQVFGQFGDG
jgi:hypothetical protein